MKDVARRAGKRAKFMLHVGYLFSQRVAQQAVESKPIDRVLSIAQRKGPRHETYHGWLCVPTMVGRLGLQALIVYNTGAGWASDAGVGKARANW